MAEVDNSLSRKAKDVVAGFAGGAVQVLIGQPFDMIKVRLQTNQFKTTGEAFTSILKNEGIFAFYKGTLAPLVGVGACVSVQFYGFYEAKRQILNYTQQKELNLKQFYVAGAVAGIVNTPITAPVEQLRILMQTQPEGAQKLYHGPRDALRKIYASHGLSGIFRGFNVTLLREAQAYGVWFLTYEFLIQRAISQRNIKREDIGTPELLLYGALAGDALWLASFPLDVVKTRLQSGAFGNGATARSVARDLLATQGLTAFWRGVGPALVRAIPCSSATFATVELTLRLLG